MQDALLGIRGFDRIASDRVGGVGQLADDELFVEHHPRVRYPRVRDGDNRSAQLASEIEHWRLLSEQPGESADSVQALRAAWASARLEEHRAALAKKPGAADVLNRACRIIRGALQSVGAWRTTKRDHQVESGAPTAEPAGRTFAQPPREGSHSAPPPPSRTFGPSQPEEPLQKASSEKARDPAANYWSEARRRPETHDVSRKVPTVRWNKEAAKTLGVAPNASVEQIRTAYLRLARLYHPDMATGASTAFRTSGNARMKEINAAYKELLGRD